MEEEVFLYCLFKLRVEAICIRPLSLLRRVSVKKQEEIQNVLLTYSFKPVNRIYSGLFILLISVTPVE